MHVELSTKETGLRFALIALMAGVKVEIIAGQSVRNTMKQLGLSDDETRTLVRTVFLDGRPVDDLDTTVVGPDSSLALGAAMPGLVGAVLRSGSPFSVFREDISAGAGQNTEATPAKITLKVFNMVAEEALPRLLKRGVGLSAERLRRQLDAEPEAFWETVTTVRIDGADSSREELLARCASELDTDAWLVVQTTD